MYIVVGSAGSRTFALPKFRVVAIWGKTNLSFATNSDLFILRIRFGLGERAFSSAAPRLQNALSIDIKRAATLLTFKKKLMTFLFSKHIMLILLYFTVVFSALLYVYL